MKGPRLRETYLYVKAITALHQREGVVFGKHEVADVLRKWASMHEVAGGLPAANALREAAIWFDTAEHDPTPEQPNRITFREFEKQVNEMLADRRLREAP